MTQFDIIRRQTQSAARNAVAGAAGRLRRDTSLVSRASQLTGRAIREGESAWRKETVRRRRGSPGETVKGRARPVRTAPDGYVRRSPVQPVFQAADYHRRRARRAAAIALLVILICAGLGLLNQLGVFGR